MIIILDLMLAFLVATLIACVTDRDSDDVFPKVKQR